jgi:hypothetical protein
MMGQVAGRDVDGVGDACAGCLNTGESDGIQETFSFVLQERIRQKRVERKCARHGEKQENHQPLLRVVAWVLLTQESVWSGFVSRA